MRFQMSPEHVYARRCIFTLLAFVKLYSTVRFQMCPQLVCPRRYKVTLVGFVWLFSIVRFQMSLQHLCTRRCIVTLVAFMWLYFSIFLQDFHIRILQTKVIIFKILLHCTVCCVLRKLLLQTEPSLSLTFGPIQNCLLFHGMGLGILSLFHN